MSDRPESPPGQAPPARDEASRILERVRPLLTAGEEVRIAVQQRSALGLKRFCVVLTNRRFLVYKPGLLGSAEFDDYSWSKLSDARLKEGVFGATLTLQTVDGDPLVVEHLPKGEARRAYAIAQEMEDKVKESRRRRELEEKRASSGGVVVQTPEGPAPEEASDPVARLMQLKAMLESGLISADEYEEKKQVILSRM